MGPREKEEKNLIVLGRDGAGKSTTIGCMLFKYGAIDMLTMERFQQEGIRTYDQAARKLKGLEIAPNFYTPIHHITVLDVSDSRADCAIFVLSADTSLASGELVKDISDAVGQAKQLIILINKMDAINWSEDGFQKLVGLLGHDIENIPVIPISALNSDNIVEKSRKCPWYKGWKKTTQSGTTVLEALDISLQY